MQDETLNQGSEQETKKEAAKPASAGAKKEAAKPVKKVRVTIHAGGDQEEDKADVVLVHNYNQIVIQRNKEVLIPEHFVEVLENAAIDTTTQDENGVKSGIRIPRFAFTVKPE